MGFGYNLGWGKGMDPKAEAQSRGREEKRLEYKIGLWLLSIWVPWGV